jgi:hypothetical protein
MSVKIELRTDKKEDNEALVDEETKIKTMNEIAEKIQIVKIDNKNKNLNFIILKFFPLVILLTK